MKVTLYLRREVLRMHVHPDADFSDYWTVLETVAHALTPQLPDRVSAVVVLEQGWVRYACEHEREPFNVSALEQLPPAAQARMQAILAHHGLQVTPWTSPSWPGRWDALTSVDQRAWFPDARAQ
ncbi:hypothetical protein WDJ50_15225 [Deinococcus sp. VB142]|uniref:Uncharacterized protein n=1 Tax=Deinococcus sp. VB142 TaxID=3112952 RepID=A0AAU6Q7A9_9DEIO